MRACGALLAVVLSCQHHAVAYGYQAGVNALVVANLGIERAQRIGVGIVRVRIGYAATP